MAHSVKEEGWKLNRKVTLLFTVYEEVGHGGSFVPADTEEMISVDMGCVGADLGCTEHMVSICAKDSGGPYNYELVTELSNLTMQSMFIRTTALMLRQHCTVDMISVMGLLVQEFMHRITMSAHIWMAWRILISF